MKNDELAIVLSTRLHGMTQVFMKEGDGWLQVSSRGHVFKMTAEQVLSHLLPVLAAGPNSRLLWKVVRVMEVR